MVNGFLNGFLSGKWFFMWFFKSIVTVIRLMTDVLVKKDIDQSELFKNQREPKSKSERRL